MWVPLVGRQLFSGIGSLLLVKMQLQAFFHYQLWDWELNTTTSLLKTDLAI